MASLTNIRKLTEGAKMSSPRPRSCSFSVSHSTRSLNGETMDVINPSFWDHRMSVDFNELEVGEDPADEDFSEEIALKSPPQEW